MTNKNDLPVFAISPKHTTLDFDEHWTLEDKIEVFIARVEGWQIGVAKEIIQKEIAHRGFALLHIILSYFEMLGKYLDGFTEERKSRYYFRKGVKATFPNIGENEKELLNTLYESVRNGLYHIGMTKVNVMLRDDISHGSIGYNQERDILIISPDRLVDDLETRFQDYAMEIRNPENIQLRSNFEKRFDYDNGEASI